MGGRVAVWGDKAKQRRSGEGLVFFIVEEPQGGADAHSMGDQRTTIGCYKLFIKTGRSQGSILGTLAIQFMEDKGGVK